MEPTDERQALDLLQSMYRDLRTRAQRTERFDDYYSGKHNLVFATEQFRATFGGLFREFADNWCEIIVNAPLDRMTVNGFRLADGTAGDEAAWRIWQDNGLDADSHTAHLESLVHSVAYGLVWPAGSPDESPTVTIEHPYEVIVAHAAGDRRTRKAALKAWKADDGKWWATLYTPSWVWKFKSTSDEPALQLPTGVFPATHWARREVDGEKWPLPNPLGVVPVVPLPNRPRLMSGGRSELDGGVLAVQDAVNKLVTDMMVAAEFTAMRQRWATGWDIPRDPETDQPLEQYQDAVKKRLWTFEDPTVEVGEFGQTDLGNYVKAVNMLVQHLASQTRTPPHYFYLGNEFPRAESLKPAEAGLTSKVRRQLRHFGEGWEEIMRLALKAQGDPRGDDARIETIWADPESRTEAELVDSLIKKRELGVPSRQLWEDAGYTEAQIARFDEMRRQDAAMAATAGLADLFSNGAGEPMLDASEPGQP